MAMSEATVTQVVQLVDVLVFGIVTGVVYSVYIEDDGTIPWDYCAATGIAVALMVSFFFRADLYEFDTIAAWPRRMLYLVILMGAVFVLLVGLGFALKVSENFSRVWAFSTFVGATVAMFTTRGIAVLVLRRWARSGRFRRRIAIYGAGLQAEEFVRRLRRNASIWEELVGVYDDRKSRVPDTVGGQPIVGGLGDLFEAARANAVDSVVVTLPWHADRRVSEVVQHVRELPVHVYLGSDLVGYALPAHTPTVLSGVSVLKVVSAPLSGWKQVVKAIEDRVLGVAILIAVLPLLSAIAVAIKIDSPGPILFRQRRFGFNNNEMVVWKFRTMYHKRPPDAGVPQATRDDPRVTRVGRLLRRTSLDELPQLIHVLEGSMSLVGPRPHAVEHNKLYAPLIEGYSARHNVKPGLTGWAQVNGLRGETDTLDKMKERVTYDIYYVENWSIWFDVRIIFLTLAVIWRQSTAY